MVRRGWITWQRETRGFVAQDVPFHVSILRSRRCIPEERAPERAGSRGGRKNHHGMFVGARISRSFGEGDREATTRVGPNYLSWLLVIVIGRRANG